MKLLDDRRALVTGGANGIGRAIVERFVTEGAAVATVDIEPIDDLGADVVAFQRDLAKTDELDALVDQVEETLGPLDVLVNNAGIFEPAHAVDLSLASYRRVLAVNLDAPVFLSTSAARRMISRGYGRIVNITSIHGRFGEEEALSYDAAKGGLEQATRTLAIFRATGCWSTQSRRVSSRRACRSSTASTSSTAIGSATSTCATGSCRCAGTPSRPRSHRRSRGSRAPRTRT
jgi:NAD(P)-dependent dehydrogenase (short-subunit alcohol dehydrogenase family)